MAEHLKPGEDYAVGAVRGLFEELSVSGITTNDVSLIREAALLNYDDDVKNIHDHEFQACFKVIYDGDFNSSFFSSILTIYLIWILCDYYL